MQSGEPSGDKGSRFGRRLIDDLVVGKGEKLLGLAETARVDQRFDTDYKVAPPIPGFVSPWY